MLSLFAFPLWLNTANAKIEVTKVIGASNYELPDEENANLTIYGGTAGPACAAPDNINPCDNCGQVTGLQKCNPRRIYSSLRLRIEFRSDSTAGIPKLLDNDNNLVPNATIMGSIASNSVGAVETVWQDYCNAIDDTTSCEEQKSGTVKIGFDTNNDNILEDVLSVSVQIHDPSNSGTDFDLNEGCAATSNNQGICDYVAFPGDGKAFITSPEPGVGFPLANNIRFDRLRIYVSETDFICSPSEATLVKDLTISSSATVGSQAELTNRVVDGLTNGSLYYFRIATVDKAQNINNFMADSVIQQNCGSSYSCGGGRSLAGLSDTCRYRVRPDEVLGLLTEDFNCFIATAAYGSPLDDRLQILRQFRSEILNRFSFGRSFINFYYTEGPYAAKWVSENPWTRPFIQFFLWPIWMFAWISLNWGLSIAAGLTFFSFGFPVLVYLFLRRRTFRPQQEKALE